MTESSTDTGLVAQMVWTAYDEEGVPGIVHLGVTKEAQDFLEAMPHLRRDALYLVPESLSAKKSERKKSIKLLKSLMKKKSNKLALGKLPSNRITVSRRRCHPSIAAGIESYRYNSRLLQAQQGGEEEEDIAEAAFASLPPTEHYEPAAYQAEARNVTA